MTNPIWAGLAAAAFLAFGALAQDGEDADLAEVPPAPACPAPPADDAIDFGARETAVVRTAGGEVAFEVLIADSPEERERGLMFVPALAPDEGMLFDFEDDGQRYMWMDNTCAALDIAYLRADGTIAGIARGATPFSRQLLPSPGPVRGVLEIAAGRAMEAGIRPGDRVIHPLFGGDPAAAAE